MSWLDGIGVYASTCPFATQDGRQCVLPAGHEEYHFDGRFHVVSSGWLAYRDSLKKRLKATKELK